MALDEFTQARIEKEIDAIDSAAELIVYIQKATARLSEAETTLKASGAEVQRISTGLDEVDRAFVEGGKEVAKMWAEEPPKE